VQIRSLTKLNLTSTQGLASAFVLIAVLAMYQWTVAPQVTYLRAVQRYEPVLAQAAREQAAAHERLASDMRALQELEARLDRLRSLLFCPGQVQSLTGDLEALAVRNGCTLTRVDMGSDRPRRAAAAAPGPLDVDEVRVTLVVTGEYDGLLSFIADVQAYARRVEVRSLGLEPVGPQTPLLECRMDVGIHVIQENEEVRHD